MKDNGLIFPLPHKRFRTLILYQVHDIKAMDILSKF